ncbi:SycD/LcrH family type III secretion system chaperone [Rugamonas aquatica]|uniref:CesD/SycD/LcrH family type III secretion system chaperone n=1 Tax=Rugamonas aquatica TaxID=2743357 RepID=A0A6A7N6R9_9BURK|nr:SycD/LcrH family type III secretion system chaperone [Rugamonas aquatica]MQA40736.1 CesD/SycD/LcrH family type III secretion system chaperone [Rugamonas aquatica]
MQANISASAEASGQVLALAGFLAEHGGTLAQGRGIDQRELEAAYALAYNLYGQARWEDALAMFDFLCAHDHLQRRFHIGRAACLQMHKQYERALVAYGVAHLMDVDDPDVGLRIAECLAGLGRHADARLALATVAVQVEGKPEHDAVGRRAQALFDLLAQVEASA